MRKGTIWLSHRIEACGLAEENLNFQTFTELARMSIRLSDLSTHQS